jgi:broad specificity phosphatase PhoE
LFNPLLQDPVKSMPEQKWPDAVWIVRHGQSAGNVARDAAEAAALPEIDVATRDVDTPLSRLGEQQSLDLGRWFASLPEQARPNFVLTSPYIRALTTSQIITSVLDANGEAISMRADERLREKEFGILDRLTKIGVEQRYPELAEQRGHVGKFYFRPPGGESWCDVILRLRSIIDTLTREYRRERVLIVAHQVIVNCFRYLFERLDESQILEIDRQLDVPNCSITAYRFDPGAAKKGKLMLDFANFIAPMEAVHTPITSAPDAPERKKAGA